MKTIKLTQGKVTLIDDIDYEYLNQFNWCAARCRNGFRAMRSLPIDGKWKTLFIYTVIAERMGIDTKLIDHKDGNPLNNQRSNLRSATNSQNLHNHGANSNNTTGVKGVCVFRGKYRARIQVRCKQHHLGDFDTIAEAERVIVAKRIEMVGEFAAA